MLTMIVTTLLLMIIMNLWSRSKLQHASLGSSMRDKKPGLMRLPKPTHCSKTRPRSTWVLRHTLNSTLAQRRCSTFSPGSCLGLSPRDYQGCACSASSWRTCPPPPPPPPPRRAPRCCSQVFSSPEMEMEGSPASKSRRSRTTSSASPQITCSVMSPPIQLKSPPLVTLRADRFIQYTSLSQTLVSLDEKAKFNSVSLDDKAKFNSGHHPKTFRDHVTPRPPITDSTNAQAGHFNRPPSLSRLDGRRVTNVRASL